jgi:hypothetical protein
MLLALVLMDEDLTGWGGLAAGVAAAMKQTAWPLLGFAFLALPGRKRGTFAVGVGATALVLVLPFVLWGPSAFVEDVVRFPLGLGREASAAGTPTVGSLLVRAFPGERTLITVLLAAAILAVGLWLAFRTTNGSVADAARNTGIFLAAAVVLAPSARFGYVVYPANLLVWGALLRRPVSPPATAPVVRGASR